MAFRGLIHVGGGGGGSPRTWTRTSTCGISIAWSRVRPGSKARSKVASFEGAKPCEKGGKDAETSSFDAFRVGRAQLTAFDAWGAAYPHGLRHLTDLLEQPQRSGRSMAGAAGLIMHEKAYWQRNSVKKKGLKATAHGEREGLGVQMMNAGSMWNLVEV